MKKTFITLSILFLVAITALGQSVTITPTTDNQNSTVVFGNAIPNYSGFRGGLTVGSATVSGNALLSLRGFGHTGTGFSAIPNGVISINADENFTSTAQGTSLSFFTTRLGTTTISEKMRISNAGNVGIGTSNPLFKLDVLHDGTNGLRVKSTASGSNINIDAFNGNAHLVFLNNGFVKWVIENLPNNNFKISDGGSVTRFSIQNGTGNVGLGTDTPTAKLEVNGFTKLGTDAPAIKVKKLTGTTAASEGANVTVAHGLTRSKIISATVLVDDGSFSNFPNSPIGGVNFYFEIDATNVIVYNSTTQSELILSKPIVIMITYEE